MIAAIEWVPAGVAEEHPKKYEMNAAEKEVLQLLQEQEEGDQDNTTQRAAAASDKTSKVQNDLPADLRMDEYSDDEQEGVALGHLLVGDDEEEPAAHDPNNDDKQQQEEEDAKTDGNIGDANNDMDEDSDEDDDDDNLEDVPDTREYTPIDVEGLEAMGLGKGGGEANEMFLEDESDAEDVRIAPEDAVMVVAKTDEDFASLEVHLYDTTNGNLFIHHDIPLPSFPLCLAHGQVSNEGSSSGNFCAVGTFDPGIEIWNLDVINALEPTCVLGGEDTTLADTVMKENLLRASSGQKLKRPPRNGAEDGISLRPGSHTGAVMGLSWNQVHRHVIASGSADHTVKIWDVSLAGSDNNKANAGTFKHHKDKVQAVQWHPVEATILATGSYDRTVALLDARDSAGNNIKKVKIPSDCEALAWDPFHPELLTAACEDGTIMCWDVRKFTDKSPMWSFVANEFGGISDLSYNRHVPGMMATASIDKTVALWDTYSQNDAPQSKSIPRACGSKDMKVGKLYSVSFYPSSPWLLGCGGSDNQLALWDMSSEAALQNRFGKRVDGWKAEDAADGEAAQETDFEAAMVKQQEQRSSSNNNKKKKKGREGKKKVNKRGR